MKDYLSQYGYTPETKAVRSFQAGGGAPAAPAPAPAPAPGPGGPEGGAPAPGPAGGGDLQAELMQVVETQDPQLALAFVNKLAEQMAAAQPAGPEGPPAPEGMYGGQMPAQGGGMGMAGGAVPGYMGGGASAQPFRYKKGGKLGVFSKDGNKVSFSRK